MSKKKELSTKRKYELEQIIKSTSINEVIDNNKLSLDELVYIVSAVKMPYQDVLKDIIDYDSNKDNPVNYSYNLAEKYNVSYDDAIKRVQDIKKISKYEMNINSSDEMSLKMKQTK